MSRTGGNDPPKWRVTKEALTAAFERLDARVRHAIPELHGGLVTRRNLGAKVFSLQASYMWNTSQQFEDVIISFECVTIARPAPMSSIVSDAPEWANAYLTFEVERGTGETLEIIGPLFLVRSPRDNERSQEVTAFAQQVLDKLPQVQDAVLEEMRMIGHRGEN